MVLGVFVSGSRFRSVWLVRVVFVVLGDVVLEFRCLW